MKKLITHIRRWNVWRKRNCNSKFHKLIVLLGIIKSPTMMYTMLPEELEMIQLGFLEGLIRGHRMGPVILEEWETNYNDFETYAEYLLQEKG